MKKLVLLCCASAFMTIAAFSQVQPQQQQDQQKEQTKQDRADWEKKVKDELKLTNDQAAKYDALNTEYNAKIDAVMSDASLSKDAQKEKKMALKKEKEAKMMEFLTPDQQAKYKELVEKKKKEMAATQPGA